jgi:hypothetical protein
MAIPKKGTRPITVDGNDYRWLVRRKPTYSQGNGWTPMTVAVSSTIPNTSALVATLATNRPDAWINADSKMITPGEVANLIRLAIVRGWNPAAPGSPFQLNVPPQTPLLPVGSPNYY